MRAAKHGGGWHAIWYTLRIARRVGWRALWRAMRTKNACKTCALGMGGQAGGMRNELGHWPEVCKKSLQAMVADMQGAIAARFFEQTSLAQLRSLTSRELEACGRLTTPVYAGPGDTHFREVDWDFALERVVRQLRETPPHEHFFYCSGRSSNEAGFLLQLFARLYGTNYVHNCSYYCHQASGVALGDALGVGTATVGLDDLDACDLFVLVGANPASNHPRLMRTLMQLRRRGGHVLVVNPLREVGLVSFRVPSDLRSLLFGSRIASRYVQPHVGGDVALLAALAKLLLERGAADEAFLREHTTGAEAYLASLRAASLDGLLKTCSVARAEAEAAAEMLATSRRTVFGWCMGITHHAHGVDNVRAIANLALLRGMVGKPGAGLLPIRGHSNVQGLGSMGVVPDLRKATFENLERALGVSLPTSPGMDTMACMEAADQGKMRAALCLGGNLYGSNPDARFASAALGKLELVTYLTTTLNTGHAWGRGRETLILPVLARDEEPQATTQESMFNFVRLSDGGPARHAGPRAESAVVSQLAQRLLGGAGPVDWASLGDHCAVRALIARCVPGYAGAESIGQTKREFAVAGRTLREPRFATPDGKARLAIVPVPEPLDVGEGLRLMTIRSEGQFNTVVYEEEDLYRGQERRDVILVHPSDLARLGLTAGERVDVVGPAGTLSALVRPFDVKPGNAAMYYPEANLLVPRTVDPRSKTPAFKAVRVTLVRPIRRELPLANAAAR